MSDPTDPMSITPPLVLSPEQVLLVGDITEQLAAAPMGDALCSYAPIFAQVAVEIRGDERARRLAQIAPGIRWRESSCGAALRPTGPTGYGDWARRQWPARRFAQYPDLVAQGDKVLDADGNQHANAAGEALFWTLLRAGKGFGFGLDQLDAQAHQALVQRKLPNGQPAWQDPLEHTRMTMKILADGLDAFPGDERAGIDTYNAGPLNVQRAEAAPGHNPDSATTNMDYSEYVLSHVGLWFPKA